MSILPYYIKRISFLQLIFLIFGIFYGYLFYKSISLYWFSPDWTTDDAFQQVYPFYKVLHPDWFKGDLITLLVEGYLAPLHYLICYVITLLCGDPIMMSHWVMLIQIVLSLLFMFLAVRSLAGNVPAIFSVVWLLHTREIIQRITGGLPRGWAAVILTCYLYLLLTKRHKTILLLLFLGSLLNPPAAFVAGLSYGIYLLWQLVFSAKVSVENKKKNIDNIIRVICFAPILVLVLFFTIKRPPEIGQMVSYEQASAMPEFQNPGGRFPFMPLHEPSVDIKMFGFQAFVSRLYIDGKPYRNYAIYLTTIVGILLILSAIAKGRTKGLPEFLSFFLAIIIAYYASRLLAFKLYVPNRHLQFPLAILYIAMFSSIGWRVFSLAKDAWGSSDDVYKDTSFKSSWVSALWLVTLSALIYIGSGTGLYGDANFNSYRNKTGKIWTWIQKYTPQDAVIAGHPSYMDPVYLFGQRQGYITTETSHPFYPTFYKEAARRLEIALRAYYAHNLTDFVQALGDEKIDYFIFYRKDFYPEQLQKAKYYEPLNQVVKELIKDNDSQYAYKELPTTVDIEKDPSLVYRDDYSAVVDINALKQKMLNKKENSIKK